MKLSNHFEQIGRRYLHISEDKKIARYQWYCFVVLAVLCVIHFIFRRELGDFEVFYRAGVRFLSEDNIYKLDEYPLTFKYFPVNALLFAFPALLPFKVAGAIWYFLIFISGWLALNLSFKMVAMEEGVLVKFWYYPLIIVLIGAYWLQELTLGQVNIIMFYGLLRCIYASFKNNNIESALWWNFAFIVKPYALLFLPYLLWRKKIRSFLYSTIILVIVFCVPMFQYGFFGFFELLQGIQKTAGASSSVVVEDFHNVSVFGMLYKLGVSSFEDIKIIAVVIGITLSICFAIWSFRKNETFQTNAEISIMCLFVPIFSPQGWNYIFWCAMPGMIWMLSKWHILSRIQKSITWFVFFNIGGIQYEILRPPLYYWYQHSPILPLSMITFIFLIMYTASGYRKVLPLL